METTKTHNFGPRNVRIEDINFLKRACKLRYGKVNGVFGREVSKALRNHAIELMREREKSLNKEKDAEIESQLVKNLRLLFQNLERKGFSKEVPERFLEDEIAISLGSDRKTIEKYKRFAERFGLIERKVFGQGRCAIFEISECATTFPFS